LPRAAARARTALCWLACCGAAQAQVGGSLTLASDYRYHGYSLSEGRPVAQLLLTYDAPSGWYGGLQVSRARGAPEREAGTDLLGYGGYARRLDGGLALDVGVAAYTYSAMTTNNYQSIQLGVSAERVSARMSYLPDYLGLGVRSVYLQADAGQPLAAGFSLFGHLGHMQTLGTGRLYGRRSIADFRVGLGLTAGDWNLQLARDGADTGAYNGYQDGAWTRAARSRTLLIATRPF